MIKSILTYPKDKDILSQKSEEVKEDEDISELIQDLKDTLYSIPSAKGLSAIQIGINKRVCFVSWGGDEYILINPVITRTRGEQEYLEGCLSVPFTTKKVTRAQKVWCNYIDEEGNKKEIAQGGRMSDIIQHELDHFEGVCKIID